MDEVEVRTAVAVDGEIGAGMTLLSVDPYRTFKVARVGRSEWLALDPPVLKASRDQAWLVHDREGDDEARKILMAINPLGHRPTRAYWVKEAYLSFVAPIPNLRDTRALEAWLDE